MNDGMKNKMLGLMELYQQSKRSGDRMYREYIGLMEQYRAWQRENILDYDKLVNYSDEEFVKVFGEMFDHADGTPSSHGLARGMHFNTPESRLEVRKQFEKAVKHILDSEEKRFELLDEILGKDSEYRVPGLGKHMMTTLINAAYPDVPPINGTTVEFFKAIGRPLAAGLTEQQKEVSEFFDEMVELSGGDMTPDDVNLMFWYAKTNQTGENYMRMCFG